MSDILSLKEYNEKQWDWKPKSNSHSQRLSDTRHTAHSTQLLICLNDDHRPAAKQIPPKFI